MTIEISKICKRFGKRSLGFTDNAVCEGFVIKTQTGRNGFTEIPDELLYEFLLWLSPETRTMLATQGIQKTLDFAKTYKKVV